MNENRSFLVTLLLTVGSGVVIGLFAFGLTGKGDRQAPVPATNQAATASAAPSPSTSSDPMPPVQYDDPDGSAPQPEPTNERTRKVLM